jgi:hypothetical protein
VVLIEQPMMPPPMTTIWACDGSVMDQHFP